MSTNSLRESLLASVAGLFLVLILCLFVMRRPQPSMGLSIPVMKLKQHTPSYVCEDDIPVVLRLKVDGSYRINWTEVTPEQLRSSVTEIFRGRQEPVVYAEADPSVSYNLFVEFLAVIKSTTPGLHVILLTPQLTRYVEGPIIVRVPSAPAEYMPPCDLEWKENGFDAPSMSEEDSGPTR